ncbi:MAG: FAD:protein FMN transferase [Bacteroidales bacterium]|nr:FAD:protein FMN transferase [Bacteroidales bacterium]
MKSPAVKLLLAAFALTLAASCSKGYLSFSGYAQGGVYTIQYNASGTKVAPATVRDSVEALLSAIDRSLSGYNASSTLSRHNRGEKTEDDPLFDLALAQAETYFGMTGGAVDCWSAPVFDLWGFGFDPSTGDIPSPDDIREALRRSAARSQVNFNAFAQGLSCDLVAQYLKSIGVKDLLVDIGEIYCEGSNRRGEGWTIGIDNPRDGNDTPGAELKGVWTSDKGGHGVVTSGNYRKFYVKDGRKYSHTIDPKTGLPVTHSLLSATIVAPSASLADAIATGQRTSIHTVRARHRRLSDCLRQHMALTWLQV